MNTKYKVEVYVMFDRLVGSGVKKTFYILRSSLQNVELPQA